MRRLSKLIVSAVLVLCLCASTVLCVGAVSTSSLGISVESKQVNAGDTFEVKVNVTENPGIVALKLLVEYDADVLTLENVADSGVLGTAVLDDTYASPYGIVWENSTAASNITATGTIITLTFTAKDVAADAVAAVNVKLASANDCLDYDLNKIPLNVTGGSIAVAPADVLVGDLNGDKAIDGDDAIYLLYHTVHGAADYPLNQDVDFDGNGVVNSNDAVYLLYHSLYESLYPLH